jgi:adenine phosphoribosyltransferase
MFHVEQLNVEFMDEMVKLTDIEEIKNSIRNIPDFPRKGIQFKDVSTAFKNERIFKSIVAEIKDCYKTKEITKVVAIESRGFILGGALANELNAGFVPIRKPGKLPSQTFSQSYELEYGIDVMEIHSDALDNGDIVLIHDDLLATGGTMNAAIQLVKKFGVKDIFVNFFVELDFLKGRDKIKCDHPVWSLVHF